MDKKELKFYDAPAMELVVIDVNQQLLAGSTNTNAGNVNMGEDLGEEPED